MESNIIEVLKPERSKNGDINFVTECAFGALLEQARKRGLHVNPVMGLMYLPDQTVTRQFQIACRAVLDVLDSK